MSRPAEMVAVRCPKCSHTFETWYRASFNIELEAGPNPTPERLAHLEEYASKMNRSVCPLCKHEFDIAPVVIVDRDGVFNY